MPKEKWRSYTDGLGFKIDNTDKGDMSINIYIDVRYLNQLASRPSYTFASTGQTTSSSAIRRQRSWCYALTMTFVVVLGAGAPAPSLAQQP